MQPGRLNFEMWKILLSRSRGPHATLYTVFDNFSIMGKGPMRISSSLCRLSLFPFSTYIWSLMLNSMFILKIWNFHLIYKTSQFRLLENFWFLKKHFCSEIIMFILVMRKNCTMYMVTQSKCSLQPINGNELHSLSTLALILKNVSGFKSDNFVTSCVIIFYFQMLKQSY